MKKYVQFVSDGFSWRPEMLQLDYFWFCLFEKLLLQSRNSEMDLRGHFGRASKEFLPNLEVKFSNLGRQLKGLDKYKEKYDNRGWNLRKTKKCRKYDLS